MNRTIAISLLILTGISAVLGGWGFVADPSGETLQMSLDWLERSPFSNYFIPGLILMVILGFGSLLAALICIRKSKSYPLWVIAFGAILIVWISTQILMIRMLHWLQFLYGGIGLILLFLGIKEKESIKKK